MKLLKTQDLLELIRSKQSNGSEPLRKIRRVISAMNIVAYLKYYSEYKENNLNVIEEFKNLRNPLIHNFKSFWERNQYFLAKFQLKLEEDIPENLYFENNCEILYKFISYFQEKTMDEFERKREQNLNIKDKLLKKEMLKYFGKQFKKKLSKLIKDFRDSNNSILLDILREAKFFSFILDYDMGILTSPTFIEETIIPIYKNFDLQEIISETLIDIPRWCLDLTELKNFLLFSLWISNESNYEGDHLILERLETLIRNLNY